MEEFEQLVALCKGAVELRCNDHRSSYESVGEAFQEKRANTRLAGLPDDATLQAMVEADCVYELQCYPHTPISFFLFIGPRLEPLVREALAAVRAELFPGDPEAS